MIRQVPLEDPTDRQVKLGRTWFNDADASTTGTYSCASCHPDGHTDQLLWVLKTPIVTGGNQIMPRSTMPIRGLRDTAPFHWDGIPGDPYGGNNSANVWGSDEPNSDVDKPESATRHLIDGGLAATMLMHGSETINDEGKSGAFSAAERDDMSKFLLAVPYPPAQKRAYTNVVSKRATAGFELFHINGHHDEKPKPNVCGDCHRMPFMVSTNTPGTGMDAPTWRGAYDRFLILPQGRLNIIEFDFYRRIAEEGLPERKLWQFSWQGQPRFDPSWEMALEGSTGFSGAFARQVTLSESTAKEELTADLMNALEMAADEGAIVLEAEGVFIDDAASRPVDLQFVGGTYVTKDDERLQMTRGELVNLATSGEFLGTFTARHGAKADAIAHPQPALWTLGPIEKQSGHQEFPILFRGEQTMTISGCHIDDGANVIVDGRRARGSVTLGDDEQIEVQLTSLPEPGIHLLQIQNPGGLFSNDFIFNEQQPRSGSTPLSNAALHGRLEIAEVLIRRGANVNGTNRDGNTPLHVAAFLCREDLVKLFLEKGGSPIQKNRRGETPIDVVSAPWSEELAGFYTAVGKSAGFEVDLERIEKDRPRIASLLREQ